MGERAQLHVRSLLCQLRYPFQFRGDVCGGRRLLHLSLERFHVPVPPSLRRVPRVGSTRRGEDEVSQVPGDPSAACRGPRSRQSRGALVIGLRPPSASSSPSARATRRPLRLASFRDSIARPARSLSTLRRQGCPLSRRKTRFRLVTFLRRSGLEPAGIHHEVSVMCFYMASSSSRLLDAPRGGAERSRRDRRGHASLPR